MVVPVRVLSMHQIELFNHLLYLKPSKTLKQERYTLTSKGVKILKVACWYVRTMLDAAHSNRPAHHSVLIAHELSKLNVDIAVLSEVHFPGEAASKSMALDTPFSGQGNLQQASVSWSTPPSLPCWKIC